MAEGDLTKIEDLLATNPPFLPAARQIVARRLPAKTETKGGIVLTTGANDKVPAAVVLACGDMPDGCRIPRLDRGTIIFFLGYLGATLVWDDVDYFIISDNDVLGWRPPDADNHQPVEQRADLRTGQQQVPTTGV